MLKLDALQQLRQLKADLQASKPEIPVILGTVKATSGRFGFVSLDTGEDVYLPTEQMQRVLPGDRVEVLMQTGSEGKPFAEIDKLLSSNLKTFVGQYLVKGNGHFVVPDLAGLNRWVFIPPRQRKQAQAGDWLHCRLTQHPIKDGNAQAEVLEVIGHDSLPGIELALTLAKHEIRDHWSASVEEEVATLSEDSLTAQLANRSDLQAVPFVTIDAPSSLDLDDALYAEANGKGWTLQVAIADPTSLIAPNSAMEKTARARGTSMYFPGEMRPMLAETLSNDLCSLVAGKLRLALVCEIRISPDGSLADYRLHEAVIRSAAKLSYDQVSGFLDGREGALSDQAEPVQASLRALGELSEALRNWRAEHALLGDYRPDFRIRLDENRKIRSIDRMHSTRAHRLVEDCMIAANRCAADFLQRSCPGGLFITHAGLRAERHDSIRQLLSEHCPELASVDPSTLDGFRQLMQSEHILPGGLRLRSLLIRQLERTELLPTAAPHQGMGLPAYTTMTSPLRKWLDFLVHRQIKQVLRGETAPGPDSQTLTELQQALSLARQAVNEVEQWLKCQYMKPQQGQTLAGSIVRVIPAGFAVRLDDNGVEGFVSVRDLEGKYSFDPLLLTLTGAAGSFQLDQPVTVTLLEADVEKRQIRFGLGS